jgi:hypothetical protein
MNTQELFEQMQSLWESVTVNHSKSFKAAHSRARKDLGEMKKLIAAYRKASVAEDRAPKA